MTAFEELGVLPQLGEAVSDLGWIFPTPIQCEAIPAILGGGDVLIAAETGSGKTGSFCLPVAQIIWERRKDALEGRKSNSDPPSWRLNLSDRDLSLSVGLDGLSCESRIPKSWFGARAAGAVHTKGKYYFEAKITRDGLCRIGWSTGSASLNLGTDSNSFGFGGTGKKSHNRQFDDYGESFTTGDIMGCYLDLDNLAMWWSKNGAEFPRAYNIDKRFCSAGLHPAILVQNSSLLLNFGETPFSFPPKSDFTGVFNAPSSCTNWRGANVEVNTTDPLCIVLEPTRELVEQTHKNLELFSKRLSSPTIRCLSVAAGVSMKEVINDLKAGIDVLTSTPKRIVDLVETGQLSLRALQFIVIDEADQFLSDKQGGSQLLSKLMRMMPLVASDGSRLQVIVCSATLHNMDINRFAEQHMRFPQWIDLKGMDSVAETVHHVVCVVDAFADKQWIRKMHESNHLMDDFLHNKHHIRPGTSEKITLSFGTKILKGIYVLQAIQALNMEQCIIFCRMKLDCDHMEVFLNNNGYNAACLHGDRSPQERSNALQNFKDGSISFLICTDVAARGIDVHGVPFVINVCMPHEKEVYVHRIGRVGRAERMGLSISLVSKHEENMWFHKCPSRGTNCKNYKDISEGGCTIWFNEMKMLGEVEEHLGQTISIVSSDFIVPSDEFDGKIIYGSKRSSGTTFEGHAAQLSTSVAQLADLEQLLQKSYLAAVKNHLLKIEIL